MKFKEKIEYGKYIMKVDPACKSVPEAIFTYPVIEAVASHRRAKWFYNKGLYLIARWISQRSRNRTGIEIHPGATLGKFLFIDHGMGIVIGETAVIGDYCTIYHGVTLGGTGNIKTAKRHPTVGNNVMLGAGSIILGPVNIGDNAKIGAGAVVFEDVEEGATVVGSPALRTIRRKLARPNVCTKDRPCAKADCEYCTYVHTEDKD